MSNSKSIVYFRDRKDYQLHGYTMHDLEIFVTDKPIEELWLVRPLVTLTYQKGNPEKPEAENNNRFYAETVDSTVAVNTYVFETLAAIFAKMDKAYGKVMKQGLILQDWNDLLKVRLFKLKKIGAKEVDYNSESRRYYLI